MEVVHISGDGNRQLLPRRMRSRQRMQELKLQFADMLEDEYEDRQLNMKL